MNRRGFLRSLLAGAAVVAVDPERLLWVPGTKKIFIPNPVVLADLDQITYENLRHLYASAIQIPDNFFVGGAWKRIRLSHQTDTYFDGGTQLRGPFIYAK